MLFSLYIIRNCTEIVKRSNYSVFQYQNVMCNFVVLRARAMQREVMLTFSASISKILQSRDNMTKSSLEFIDLTFWWYILRLLSHEQIILPTKRRKVCTDCFEKWTNWWTKINDDSRNAPKPLRKTVNCCKFPKKKNNL